METPTVVHYCVVLWERMVANESKVRRLGTPVQKKMASQPHAATYLSYKSQLGIKLLTLRHIHTIQSQKHDRIRPYAHNTPHWQPSRTNHIHPSIRINHIPSILDHLTNTILRHTQLQICNIVTGCRFVVKLSRGTLV